MGLVAIGLRVGQLLEDLPGSVLRPPLRAGSPGRPSHVYVLTAEGDAIFPRRYADLTNELLHYVEEESPQLLAHIFDKRGEQRLAQARERTAHLPFPKRVQVIAQILDEEAYLADFQACDDGMFVLTEHNCAILAIAQRYRHACSSELAFLQAALPQAEVTRIAHRMVVAHVCAYRVTPKT